MREITLEKVMLTQNEYQDLLRSVQKLAKIGVVLDYTVSKPTQMKDDQTPDGRIARKEIRRRQMIGYCDGTAINRGTDALGNPKANPYAR